MIKFITALLLCSSVVAAAQSNNHLLDRSFWKSKPDLKQVQQKVAAGNDPEQLNANAFDATVYAILEQADLDVLEYLLSFSENAVSKKTHDGRIYLHWATYAGSLETVLFFLDKGSATSVRDSYGNTPLTFGVNAGNYSKELFDAFRRKGVNIIDQKNEDGADLLLLAAPHLNDMRDLELFTDYGFDIMTKDNQGNGIFNYATKKGNIDLLNGLVNAGVDYKDLNNENGNAFLFAVQGARGHSNTLQLYEYLQSLGLDPNVTTITGTNALHRLAYYSDDMQVIDFFLAHNVSVNQKDASGNTPFSNAAYRNTIDVVRALSKKVDNIDAANLAGQTALMRAVSRNTLEITQLILQLGADKGLTDLDGNALPYYVLQSYTSQNPELFEQKLQLLSDLDYSEVQSDGNTLLHLATIKGDIALLKLLERFKIDINLKNNDGLTALHLAAMKSTDDQLMKYLIDSGADKSIKTDFEESVYDLASENEKLGKNKASLNFLK